jgi:benzil reductase ((S)-benzoin forming)
MNQFYITGTSTGIGHAIAEIILRDDENRITGVARRKTIDHERYWHIEADLSQSAELHKVVFGQHNDAKKLVLINNAGALGQVDYMGNLNDETIRKAYQLNLITPAIMTNQFIAAYRDADCPKFIINISSGAGTRPIDGWSVYCSSKAGMNLMSEVVALEEQTLAHKNPFRVYSVNPGLTDTPMQDEIRSAKRKGFSRLNDFIGYKEQGELVDPYQIAGKIIELIADPVVVDEVVVSVKDY